VNVPAERSRWLDARVARGADYDQKFERLEAQGHDVHGEAFFVAGLGVRRVLDAGCGTGRVALELDRRGIEVTGVDLDPAMLEQARAKAPHLRWVQADLAVLQLDRRFDAVVLAGNVMIFVAPGTEGAVLRALAGHLQSGGLLIAGFSLIPGGLDLDTYDQQAAAYGLELVERWATWDRLPLPPAPDYAVSVHRVSGSSTTSP
jgi:SAM-dependent methyltransferase